MLTIHVELDGRRLGGSLLLLPFSDAWLSSNTCRDLLIQILDKNFNRSTALVNAEVINMFCIKQQDTVTGACRNARVDKDMANATACLDMKVMSVIDGFSTLYFSFKISSLPTTSSSQPRTNPFELMRRVHTQFFSLPPRLNHARMYSNHHSY